MPRPREAIVELLKQHRAGGGCANEDVVTEWYRQWYRLDEEVEVDLETQERWANDIVMGRVPLTKQQLTRTAGNVR